MKNRAIDTETSKKRKSIAEDLDDAQSAWGKKVEIEEKVDPLSSLFQKYDTEILNNIVNHKNKKSKKQQAK